MEIRFPDDPKAILDVKRDCGAVGDGVADDSDALQRAIESAAQPSGTRFIYLPKGTYKVTKTLVFKPAGDLSKVGSMVAPWIYGQNRDTTIIRLADASPGFTDPLHPKEVLRGHWRADGAKMNADFFYRTCVNFTIDCGRNPGAIGFKFYSNNMGLLRHVRITGNGVCGLDLGWTDQNGPLLIEDVEIAGFATGLITDHMLNSQTLSRVSVTKAKVGFRVKGQTFIGERLTTVDVPQPMDLDGAVVSLVDCSFTATTKAETTAALRTKSSTLYVQRLTTGGYASAISESTGTILAQGPHVAEFAAPIGEVLGGKGPATGLGLEVRPSPEVPWETDPAKWVCANDFGAVAGDEGDDSDAFQKAIDHAAEIGATTV